MKNVRTKVVAKIETHVLSSQTFFFLNHAACGIAGQATYDNMAHVHGMLVN